jgi:cytochrome c oxidase subunit 1
MLDKSNSLNGSNGSVLRVSLFTMLISVIIFLFMGLLGLTMRFDQGGVLNLSSETFYQVMTLHGIGMTSSVLLLCMGAYAAAASRRISFRASTLWGAVLVYLIGDALVVIGIVFGGFAAGWTVLYPLPFDSRGYWTAWSALAVAAGFGFNSAGLLVYSVHILRSARRQFGGLKNLLAWKFLSSRGNVRPNPEVSPVDIVVPTVTLIGMATALEGLTYVSALFLQGGGLVIGFDSLLMYNLLYSFGHDYVNLQIYLAAGVVYAVLPVLFRREWHLSWATALAWNVILYFVLAAFIHHIYQNFAEPLSVEVFGQAVTDISVLPSLLVTIIGGLTIIYGAGIKWTAPAMMLSIGIWGWAFGGLAAILDSVIPINQVMHNTMWVPGHFHTYMILGSLVFSLGYLYYLVKDLGGVIESRMSRIAVWFYAVGGIGQVLSFLVAGAESIPRRYSVWLPQWQGLSLISIPFVTLLGVGVGWLALEMIAGLGLAWKQTLQHSAVGSMKGTGVIGPPPTGGLARQVE